MYPYSFIIIYNILGPQQLMGQLQKGPYVKIKM